MAKLGAAVCILAVALCACVSGQTTTEGFQELFNGQVSLVVAAETGTTDNLYLYKTLESTLLLASADLSSFDTDGATAVAKVDDQVESALQQIKAIQAVTLDSTALSTVTDNLCALTKSIHAYATSVGVSVTAGAPQSCYSSPAPTELWQQTLVAANSKVVGIQNNLKGDVAAAVQALTSTIEEAIAGAGLYSTTPTTGFNAITSSLNQAATQIALLLPKLSKPKQAVLLKVNTALASVQSSVTNYAKQDGVVGKATIVTGEGGSPAPAPAPTPATSRRLRA